MEAFQKHNKEYTIKKFKANRVDEAWETMFHELEVELSKGRMPGPFAAPDWWPAKSRSIQGLLELEPLPQDTPICFSFQTV